ncbi:MAG: type VI secretion system ATPase TssH [Gemmatimonadales bacterium]|nr:type VI secretion system ATPase TssH [Gemmatimonadales bacterium]
MSRRADLDRLIGRLDAPCRSGLETAAALCVQQTHYNVEIEHFLLGLLEQPASPIGLALRRAELDPSHVVRELTGAMDRFQRGNGRTPALSPHLLGLLERAWVESSLYLSAPAIHSGAVLLALLEDDALYRLITESSFTLSRLSAGTVREMLSELAMGSLPGGPLHSPEGMTAGGPTPNLDLYTVDLTALAAEGRIDAVRGRDAEIRQVIDILMRRRQNNPILTGDAGVGKTAVVEGFAQRVADREVPPPLLDTSVRALDLALLEAGAGVKGEFEQRLKAVIDEVKASPRGVILFIDEAHTLIGAGGREGQGDAANLLKPALARGDLRTIAATTWSEYKKYFEKDPALARRFQVVTIDEPGEEAAIDMLRGVVSRLERHHGVRILEEAVREAVTLSQRYLSGRRLPDKAIGVLDTACARVAIGQHGAPPAVEALQRRIEAAEAEERLLRREQVTGGGHDERLAVLRVMLDGLRREGAALEESWRDELSAVREIDRLRGEIEELAGDAAADPVECARLRAVLARVERGLEAIQADPPMVPTSVDTKVIASVISGWTGIPVGKMLTDELYTVLTLRQQMATRLVGQDDAINAIADRIQTFRAALDDPGKPVGVFLLAGASGVGKTETAITLADLLYGGERNLITVNLSEYQEAHTVSSLKGAPPGYIGYGTGGVLTEAVRRRPHSVILLDEAEKAHPDVLELFYQVFDRGSLEDGEGRSVDFRNAIILLTSNLGAETILEACRRPGTTPGTEELLALIRPELTRHFKPALLGRLVVIPYRPLGELQIRAIVRLKLARVEQRFREHHRAALTFDAAVVAAIAARCRDDQSGARNVDHLLTNRILPELSTRVLERLVRAEPPSSIVVSVDADGAFVYEAAS